jgi:serine/threonine protein phosphatase PrpC
VFDGHGGQEVAKFTKKCFPDILRKESLFTEGENVKEGLRRSFLNVDVAV